MGGVSVEGTAGLAGLVTEMTDGRSQHAGDRGVFDALADDVAQRLGRHVRERCELAEAGQPCRLRPIG